MAPRPKNPPPDRRQEILAAALDVFGQKGYAAATTAEIARTAGVTAAALYYYFPSKEELFRAAILDRKALILPPVQQAMEQMRELPPELVLRTLSQIVAEFLADERTQLVLKIVLAEGPRHPELIRHWQEQALEPGLALIRVYAQYQYERGQLPKVDPRTLFLAVNGPTFILTILRDIVRLPALQGLNNEALAASTVELLLHGILPRPETPPKE